MCRRPLDKQHLVVKFIWPLIVAWCTLNGCSDIEPAEPISTAEITNALLTTDVWLVANVRIEVEDSTLPPAVLVGAANEQGEIVTGTVDLPEVVGGLSEPPAAYQPVPLLFQADRIVLEDADRVGNYEDLGSRYNVLDGEFMTFSLRDTPMLLYSYRYEASDQTFVMNADDVDAQATVQAWGLLLDHVMSAGVPDQVADAIVAKLYGNDAIRAAIDEALTDIIHGRLENRPDNVAAADAATFALADLLAAANVTRPDIDREALAEALAEAIEEMQQAIEAAVDELVDALVGALLDKASEVVNSELPPEQLQRMISQKLYSMIEEKQDLLTAVRSVEIILSRGTDEG